LAWGAIASLATWVDNRTQHQDEGIGSHQPAQRGTVVSLSGMWSWNTANTAECLPP
jgi:hypothetical protein